MAIMVGQNNVSDIMLGKSQGKATFIGHQQLYPHAEYALQEQAYAGLFSNMENLPDFSEDHVAYPPEKVKREIVKYSNRVVEISNTTEPENLLDENQQLMMNALIDNLFGDETIDYDEPLPDGNDYTQEINDVVWTFRIKNGNAIVQKLQGSTFPAIPTNTSGSITVPSKLGGRSVVEIGYYAFSGCTELTNIIIPNGVTKIGALAFVNCTGLVSIDIPTSVTTIEGSAFHTCSSLVDVTIPSGLTCISDGMFYKCTSLQEVAIPNIVTTIQDSAFSGCRSITSIFIPSSVTSIGQSAFFGCSLANITIPSNVTSIGNYAFYRCSSLTFQGKTLAQVQEMDNYPWGISNTSVITVV